MLKKPDEPWRTENGRHTVIREVDRVFRGCGEGQFTQVTLWQAVSLAEVLQSISVIRLNYSSTQRMTCRFLSPEARLLSTTQQLGPNRQVRRLTFRKLKR